MGGINAVGVVTATSFSGLFDASNLTGTVADARISSLTASKFQVLYLRLMVQIYLVYQLD